MTDSSIDIDEATVKIIRASDATLHRLIAELEQHPGDDARATAIIEHAKRQEAVLSEVPGLEDHARQVAAVRAAIMRYYRLGTS